MWVPRTGQGQLTSAYSLETPPATTGSSRRICRILPQGARSTGEVAAAFHNSESPTSVHGAGRAEPAPVAPGGSGSRPVAGS